MSVNLSPLAGAGAQFFTDSGTPLTGGLLYTYAAGTTTPRTTYTDNIGATANSNPIVLDAAGRVPYEIWLLFGLNYKFVLKSSVGVTIGTWDNISGVNGSPTATSFYADAFTATAGQTLFTLSANPGSINNLDVSLDGSTLVAGDDFSWSGISITLTMPAFAGQRLRVAYSTVDGVQAISPGSVIDNSVAVGTKLYNRINDIVDVKDYGAVGDGVTDDTAAVQAALNSGAKTVLFPAGNYLASATLRIVTSGQMILGYGATLTSASVSASGLLIGYTGSAFVKTDNVTIEGLTLVGVDTGAGSTYSCAINLQPPTTVPYVYGGGCSGVRVVNCVASGHAFGVAATAADRLLVTGCRFGGMKYHAALSAGGYGVLIQTCFDTIIEKNHFLAVSGDRHSIYVSSDPGRTYDNNNVCKGVVINGNLIDWSGVVGTTGFETALMIRAPENLSITGNTIIGGYGGIDYDTMNGNGKNVSISGNTIELSVSPASERSCVNFLRSSGTYISTNISITGNSLKTTGTNVHGVTLQGVDSVSIVGNAIYNTNGASCIGANGAASNVVTNGNRLYGNNLTGGVYYFAGASNTDFTIGVDKVTYPSSFKWRFFTTPANLLCGFTRSATIRANSTATPVIVTDADGIVASVGTDANGIVATFAAPVSDVSNLAVFFGTNNSNIVQAYYRSAAGQAVTIGILSASGTAVPAASNNYDINIFLAH